MSESSRARVSRQHDVVVSPTSRKELRSSRQPNPTGVVHGVLVISRRSSDCVLFMYQGSFICCASCVCTCWSFDWNRQFISHFRQIDDPLASAARNPKTRKKHKKELWTSGPNEQWCVDGHEKILPIMGIAVWGVIDKCSRHELGLWAVPSARYADVALALYLRVVKRCGGE